MPSPTIVLVHGAFGDASSWRPVYDRLVADDRTPPEADEMAVFSELGRGGRLGAVALVHLRTSRAGGNLDLELDQELHGRYAATSAALAATASRMTPATVSGCDSIRKWEAPSTSVIVEPARS